MPGLTIPQPPFPDDDGGVPPEVERAMTAYTEGRGGERAVLVALAAARLFVPVVAVLTEAETAGGVTREKESDMALPTLVGADGRRAVPAFTSAASLARWRADARPVAVPTREACRAAAGESADALVVDVAGPVPYVIEGARLAVLAAGGTVTGPHDDPDVLTAVHAAVGGLPGVTGVKVEPGERAELAVTLRTAAAADGPGTVRAAAGRLAESLRGRVSGGVEIGFAPGPGPAA